MKDGIAVAESSEGAQLFASPKEIAAMYGKAPGRTVQTFLYTNPVTKEADMAVFRIEWMEDGKRKKRFAQASPIPTSCGQGWELKKPAGLAPLYNRLRIAEAKVVVVVEGEKCVHALHMMGIVAVTSPGGSGAAFQADWEPMRNKEVILWPDNDPVNPKTGKRSGMEYMRDVEKALSKVNARCYWMNPEALELGEKGDAHDFVERTMKDLKGRADIASKVVKDLMVSVIYEAGLNERANGIANEVKNIIEDMIAGHHAVHDMPWPELSERTNALKPGTITVLCGDPGDGKSFLLLQLMAHLHNNGVTTGTFELEEDRAYFLHRTLAQRSGKPEILNDKWVKKYPEEARRIHAEHQDWMNEFGKTMVDAPNSLATYDTLLEWMRERLVAGVRVLAIDPITAVKVGKDSFREDTEFVLEAKTLLRQYKASLIVVTHPRGGMNKSAESDDLAGGRAWGRFTQTVIWIKKKDDEHGSEVWVRTLHGGYERAWQTFNREVMILKARNGIGHKHGIAMTLRKDDICFQEHGPIIPPHEDLTKKKGRRQHAA